MMNLSCSCSFSLLEFWWWRCRWRLRKWYGWPWWETHSRQQWLVCSYQVCGAVFLSGKGVGGYGCFSIGPSRVYNLIGTVTTHKQHLSSEAIWLPVWMINSVIFHFVRAVANYLQVLFEKESDQPKKVISLESLLVGKTRKEASRMFFETLVCRIILEENIHWNIWFDYF